MFFFCHLFAGMILGIGAAAAFRTRMAVPVAGFSSILPDLVDKPLGHFFFLGGFLQGLELFHTFLSVLIFLAIALVMSWRARSGLLLILPAGLLLHQIMDLVWMDPVTWLSPFLGPLQPCFCSGVVSFVGWGLQAEFFSVSEWVFLAATVLAGAHLFPDVVARITGRNPAPYTATLLPAAILLLVLQGLWFVATAAREITNPSVDGIISLGNFMVGAVSLTGAAVLAVARPLFPGDAEG